MKSIVIFPIADLRRFTGTSGMYLSKPSWTVPERNRDFVRALGGLKEVSDCGISLRGLDGWIVEPFACDAKRGPKFHDMPAMRVFDHFVQWKVENRLLFFDGECSGRIEYHLECNFGGVTHPASINEVNDYLCGLKLRVRKHEGTETNEFDEFDFGRSGLLHSRALAARTVPASQFADIHNVRRHIKYMRPAIVHIMEDDENIEITDDFTRVANNTSRYLDVFHDRVRIFNNIDIPVWAIRTKKKVNQRDLRDLCLFLRRMHSEYECIKRLLLEIERGNIDVVDGLLPVAFEEYLREILKRVRSGEKKLLRRGKFAPEHASDDPGMIELASISIHDLDPSLYSQVQIALKRSRFNWSSNEDQVRGFVEQLQSRSTVVNLNVRELNMDNRQTVSNSSGVVLTQAGRDAQVKIDKSFNGFQDNTSNAELVQAIADLKENIDQAIEGGEVENPDALARDFAELADEAVSDEPRKEKLEFNGKMIIGAIKESSGLIASISKAIEVIKSLF
ncbi:hypothetical protein [Ruegeria sp. PrR005]|uniref:Uncharacterized protein n=1 Tax=Ruegeria sp. PrR005 TaxID=2706882 RepID=A0A6B2NQD9_9RHOB|nr:hypothetical protein [Ruegeria sp. PrR005]NDW46356.1 hypothetical protein [Ruegeria sp. PrR005]